MYKYAYMYKYKHTYIFICTLCILPSINIMYNIHINIYDSEH